MRINSNLLAALAAVTVSVLLVGWRMNHQFFSIPSVSMAPTLMPGDYVIGERTKPGQLARGMVVILRSRGQDYVMRLAGLPGDRIQFIGGRLWLNGAPVALRRAGTSEMAYGDGPKVPAIIHAEHFPDAPREHLILELTADGPGDDTPVFVVPSGHAFLLGDNRDDSADSRFHGEIGVGFVPVDAITMRLTRVVIPGDGKGYGKPVY